MARRWAIEDQGIAYESWLDVCADVQMGRLEAVMREQPGEAAPLALICTHRKQFCPAIRQLHEVLKERVSALTALLPEYGPWQAVQIFVIEVLRCIATDAEFEFLKRSRTLRASDVGRGFTISVLSIACCPSISKCARQVVPHCPVHRQADEQAEQHVVGNLLHQHALATN
ncbi:type 2 periplasmic-binding domain-containing protein [Paraburkholderia kirstenboschensis]|uniref:Uncharacterized protein n=1 Tax=Paraburkholderia kirstenboschensis TaxID=1245436 RepID=A0ABZ0EE33_9BURK|nr:hypothetical protein [Paraburkholderia kirstenboschensis]WOD14781.1 hypothetical protein RW095_04415 [Paraburkholderia kirstenboschensis]